MRPRDLAALEFDQVRRRLADLARSPGGKEACAELAPSGDPETVAQRLDAAWDCFRLVEQHGALPLGEFPDVRVSLRLAARDGFVLDAGSLAGIRTVLATAADVRAFFRKHGHEHMTLAPLIDRLDPLPELHRSLQRALDDDGGVTDDASDELAELRRSLRRLRSEVTRRLEELLARPTMREMLTDNYITLRNNRFVLPIRSAMAPRFQGVVQDRSASGETTFIEPLFAVELNNRMLVTAKEEEALVLRILADLTAMVRAEQVGLKTTHAALVELDTLAARAAFARRYRCTQPRIDADEVLLREARHPGLLFSGRDVTPVDLFLPPGKSILVITGPNTGGKTVALKTLGLLAAMAQSGILVPAAEGSRLPCFRAIYADVGDEQSIERDLSTFSAHVANVREIVDAHSSPALVLLDEPGVGTDPEEGAALGIGILRTLSGLGARVVVTTHYAAIKVFALSEERCVTAAVGFELETMTPRYRLSYHSVGESLALPIARRLGLPSSILAASEAARSEHARALAAAMERLEDARRRYEERAAQAQEHLRHSREMEEETARLLEELREKRRRRWVQELEEARVFVRGVRERGRELLQAIEQGQADREALRRAVRATEAEIAERAASLAAPAPSESKRPGIGDQVIVGENGIRGELLSVEGERAWIRRGTMRFEVPATQVRRVGEAPAQAVQVRVQAPPEDTSNEISLIGMRTREAVDRLDAFLDHAARAGFPSVRVIHGIGSGALKRAVAEHLAQSPYCAAFHSAAPEQGGAGVTVAELAP